MQKTPCSWGIFLLRECVRVRIIQTMPELPEVESIVCSLQPLLVGRSIVRVTVLDPRIIAGTGNKRSWTSGAVPAFVESLLYEKIVAVGRRAKNFFLVFASGKCLVGHLKMTGQLLYEARKSTALPGPHVRVVFELSQGTLLYADARRFGYLLVYPRFSDWEDVCKKAYGLEPLSNDFTPRAFAERLKKKPHVSVKAALLRQDIVSGIGNIYCDEVCFLARVHPGRPIGSLRTEELRALHTAIKTVLREAVRHGGSSISDYVLPDGKKGSYAYFHQVYGREGKLCRRCSAILQKQRIAGRTTAFCMKCQPECFDFLL